MKWAEIWNEIKRKCISSQIWYYTNGILREAGFPDNILPYITLSTGIIETLAAIVSVSIASLNLKLKHVWF